MPKRMIIALALTLASTCGAPTKAASEQEAPAAEAVASEMATKPNVVVILLDDLGFSDLGAYGSEIRTPNIDILATEGRSFSQFYVYPRCSPTRAALLTGMYPHQAGMGFLTTPADIKPEPGAYQGYLEPGLPTIAETLKEAGYATYMSGKWHLGESSEYWPTKRGFDRYFGLISGASSYFEIIDNQPRVRQMALDGELWAPPKDGFYMTDAITAKASEYLSSHEAQSDTQPFFLYLAYTAPHWPLHAPEEEIASYNGVYDGGWEKIAAERQARLKARGLERLANSELDIARQLGSWAAFNGKEDWIRKMQVYAAMVSIADRGIGEIMQQLDDQGETDNTIILLLSDNGASSEDISDRNLNDASKTVGARGSYVSYGSPGAALSNSPLRNYKGSTLEGGIRSPFIVHWPGRIRPGLDRDSVISVMDLAPSIAALAKAGPMTVEGTDISSTLFGERADTGRPIYWEHLGWRAVREGPYKAVSAMGSDQWQLFDMDKDPSERTDIAGQRPDLLSRLAADWKVWSDRAGARTLSREELMQIYMSPREPADD